jgi:thymidylate synthase
LSFRQDQLENAEEQNKRLDEERCHLCNKRFDFDLQEWEALKAELANSKAEIRQLSAFLQGRNKVRTVSPPNLHCLQSPTLYFFFLIKKK